MNNSTEYYKQGDDLMAVSAFCSRFSRRHDFDSFNMSTYQSCENCRHLSADDACIVKAQKSTSYIE